MTSLDYRLVDFDNHYYEAEDAFTRHGDDEVQRFVRWVADGKKRRLVFGNVVAAAIPNPTFNPIGKPGSFHARLKELAEHGDGGNVHPMEKFGELEPLPDQYHDRDARLRAMDEQGVERAVFFPTLGVGIDGLNARDVRMTYKLFHAFNLWLDDDWGFAHADRIYGAPFIPMLDPQLACAELDAVLERGAKVIVMRPGPAGGRSPADPAWDPYWSRIDEAGIVAAYHACPMPDEYSQSFATMWQRHGINDPAVREQPRAGVQSLAADDGDLPGARARQPVRTVPKLRVASVELGSAWVDFCLYTLDHSGGLLGRHVEAFGVTVADLPSDIFKEHIWVSPFPEDDITHLVDAIGAQRVLLGSDWPHLEGTPLPIDYLPQLGKLDAESVRRIMRDNGLELLT